MIGIENSVGCPACGHAMAADLHKFRVEEVANHLLPAGRDPDRNMRLRSALMNLYRDDQVEVKQCLVCAFCFAHPFIAANAEIYNLVTAGHEFYPRDRFEFSLTVDALSTDSTANGQRPISLLEIGAGSGVFLRQARNAGIFDRAVATEYDNTALVELRRIPGVEAVRATPAELARQLDVRFEAICMFQVLEHLDSLDELFASLRTLIHEGGQIFLSVPNASYIAVQEELTGFWDMPPNHVGRWTPAAVEAVAARHGFRVSEHRYERANDLVCLWQMAKCRFESRAYKAETVAGHVNGLASRWLRGPLKRTLAVGDLTRLTGHYGRIPPRSQWFRLEAL